MNHISIFCKNNNSVTEITTLLSDNGIDIRDLKFQQLDENSILNLVVEEEDKCLALLANHHYCALTDETLLLKAEDKPGMLAKISQQITDLGVDIRSLTLMDLSGDGNVVAISTTDNNKVRELYREQLIN